jgi:putative Mg2+ transporter-C (MgtC) family protein
MTQPLTDAELVRRLMLAIALGGMIGSERELRGKSAGFRTNLLIALGSALFAIMSTTLAYGSADPTRIAAQVIIGVGFIGAGAILRTGGDVHGLTTAATVWVNAALGVAAGGGQYHLALIGGAITLGILLILQPIERGIERRLGRDRRPTEASRSGEPFDGTR